MDRFQDPANVQGSGCRVQTSEVRVQGSQLFSTRNMRQTHSIWARLVDLLVRHLEEEFQVHVLLVCSLCLRIEGRGFMAQNLGFGVWILGFRFGVWGLGFEFWGLGFGVWGLGFGVWGSRFGFWVLGLGVWGLGFGVCCFESGVECLARCVPQFPDGLVPLF